MSCALHRSSGSLFWQLKECSGAEIQVMVLEHRLQAGPLHPCSRDVKIPKKAVEAAAEKAAELIPLRLAGVPEHFNLPWILGLERRAFVRAGIDLKWRTVPEGTGAMCKLMRAGELDLAIMVTEGAVRDILHHRPVCGQPAHLGGARGCRHLHHGPVPAEWPALLHQPTQFR